jgi:HD-GYP domain-containing protein (c-di-GMP phosphodiesterase class II)
MSLTTQDHEEYLHEHSFNVSILAVIWRGAFQSFGPRPRLFPEGCSAASCGSLLRSGETLIPKEILGSPRKLTPEEFSLVRHHSLHSEELARKAGITDPLVLAAIRSHHEQFDGKGYPDGLSGKQIPLLASIVHVADAFAALTPNRIYKSAVSVKEALNIILYYSGEHFDPRRVRCFISGIGFYPP